MFGRSSRVIAQDEMEELVKERGGCRRDLFDVGCFALAFAVFEFCLRHCFDGNLPKSVLLGPAERADSDCGWLQIMLCYPQVVPARAPADTFIGVISVKHVRKVLLTPVLTSRISRKIKNVGYNDMYLLEMEL